MATVTDGILGMDFINEFKCIINYNEMLLSTASGIKTKIINALPNYNLYVPARSEVIPKVNLNVNDNAVVQSDLLAPVVYLAGSIVSKEHKFVRLLNTNNYSININLILNTEPLEKFEFRKNDEITYYRHKRLLEGLRRHSHLLG